MPTMLRCFARVFQCDATCKRVFRCDAKSQQCGAMCFLPAQCRELQWVAVCLSLLRFIAINFLFAYADFLSVFRKQGWGGCSGMVSLCMPRLRMEVRKEREPKIERVSVRVCCQHARICTHAHLNECCHSNRQVVSSSILCECNSLRTKLNHGTIHMIHFGCICVITFTYTSCHTHS